MPDSSAGTKELYFAWIARVGAISALTFHNQIAKCSTWNTGGVDSPQEIQSEAFTVVELFHVEHWVRMDEGLAQRDMPGILSYERPASPISNIPFLVNGIASGLCHVSVGSVD